MQRCYVLRMVQHTRRALYLHAKQETRSPTDKKPKAFGKCMMSRWRRVTAFTRRRRRLQAARDAGISDACCAVTSRTIILSSPECPLGPADTLPGPEFFASPESIETLHLVISFANRLVKLVDGPRLFHALGSGDAAVWPPESQSSLQACAFMLLCMKSKIAEDVAAAEMHFSRAQEYVNASMSERPSQHLISALLLMSMMAQPLGRARTDAAVHAALAQSLSTFVHSICPDIYFSAACLSSKNSDVHSDAIAWPARSMQIGM